jgi:hypothetical protein
MPGRPCAADRDQVIETLKDGSEEERLSSNCFGEEVEAAYTARSYAQIEGLVADRPSPTRAQRAVYWLVSRVSHRAGHR